MVPPEQLLVGDRRPIPDPGTPPGQVQCVLPLPWTVRQLAEVTDIELPTLCGLLRTNTLRRSGSVPISGSPGEWAARIARDP